jgi:L-rhamnonate dehydratase
MAMGCADLAEYFIGSPPGVPLEQLRGIPGVPIAKDGVVIPSDAPGFGMEISADWLTPFFG